jgi:hypothetical protein
VQTKAIFSVYDPGVIRRIRLVTGLVMFAYVTTHFVNHALGLVSVQVMDRELHRIYQYWASPLGSFMLYSAFAIHYSLALWALWLRRSLKMPFAEAAQLILGFSIPFFLTDHVPHTRVADTFYGADYGYYSTLLYACFVVSTRRASADGSGDRLDPRHHWTAVLAEPEAVVRPLAAGPLRVRAADADLGDSRRFRGGSPGQNTASGWIMTDLAPSPITVSPVQTAAQLPVFLLALPAGALADLMDRKRDLILAGRKWCQTTWPSIFKMALPASTVCPSEDA